MKKLLAVLALFSALTFNVQAASYTYVGSFNVNQGPAWWDNPQVYSGVEAAALIFGGNASDYAISIDENSVTHTAWYDGWGDHSGRVFADTFKLDLGLAGYNAVDSVGDWGSLTDTGNGGYGDGFAAAYSAFVSDGFSATNHVWRADQVNAVPVPAAVWLFGSALTGLVGLGKRKQAKALTA